MENEIIVTTEATTTEATTTTDKAVAAVEKKAKVVKSSNAAKRGRPSKFSSKWGIVEVLQDIRDGKAVSNFLAAQLMEKGYVETFDIKSGTRGRPAKGYRLTGKGTGYVKMSAHWTRPVVEPASDTPETTVTEQTETEMVAV